MLGRQVIEAVFSLKDKFTSKVASITSSYGRLGKASEEAAAQVDRANQRSASSIQGFATRVAGMSVRLAGGVAAVVAGIVAPIKAAAQSFDELAKQADKVGVTTDFLQEIRFAGSRTGVAINAVDTAIQRFSRRLGEAGNGGGVLFREFQRLNISLRDAQGNLRSSEAVLRDYADAIQKTADPQEQLRLAFAAFDTEGAALVNTLRDGSKGLDDYAQAARDAGHVVEESMLRGAERINDRYDELAERWSIRWKRLALFVGQTFDNTATRLSSAGEDVRKLEIELQALSNQRDLHENFGGFQSRSAIDSLNKQILELSAKLDELRSAGRSALAPLVDPAPSALQKIRAAIDAAADSTRGLYQETLKLFGKQDTDPFSGLDSQASKIVETYRLISAARDAALKSPGSEDTAASFERAAGAVNRLNSESLAADMTIDRMRSSLRDVLDLQAPGSDSGLSIVPTLDEDGVQGFTDEATRRLNEAMKAKRVVVEVQLDLGPLDATLDELAASMRERSARLRSSFFESIEDQAFAGGNP